MEPLFTVGNNCEIKYKVRGSIFFGNVKQVDKRELALKYISQISELYNDASHNVFAYKIGVADQVVKNSSDDGEPAGSAGPPVLQVIEGQKLSNIVLVVTRYFGGTKLGIGGLIRAYGETARRVIKKAGIQKLEPFYKLRVSGDYDLIGNILGQIESLQGKILDTDYNNSGGVIFFLLKADYFLTLKEKLITVTGNKVNIHKEDLIYLARN